MDRPSILQITLSVVFVLILTLPVTCFSEPYAPQAPAHFSWLPHGYGNTMHVVNSLCDTFKGYHGFRPAPEYIGCWSQPLWGWDVNGFYLGPQVPAPDPGECQLAVGLIYPDVNVAPPPPVARLRR
jgi:hypothetical protein